MNTYPTYYTYLIGWSKLNFWYYGRRTSQKSHPSDLWTKYFTSSNLVKLFRQKHGDPDIIEVRRTFFVVQECVNWEIKVIRRMKASKSEFWLNQSHGQAGVGHKPKGCKEKDSTRQKKSATAKQMLTVRRIVDGQYFRVSREKGLEMVSSGEYCHLMKGRKKAPQKEEVKQAHSERMKGSIPWNKGKVGVQLSKYKGVPRPKCSCVVCHKEVDIGNLHKYHKHNQSPEAIDSK